MIQELSTKIADPWELFSRLSKNHAHGFYFDNWGGEGVSYFGFDPEKTVQGKANESSEKIYEKISAHLAPTNNKNRFPFESGVVGLIGYNLCAEFEEYPRKKKYATTTPDFHFGLYNTIVLYDHAHKKFFISQRDTNSESAAVIALCDEIHMCNSDIKQSSEWSADHFIESIGKKGYEKYVERTVDYINAGDIFQANLAHPIQFDFSGNACDLFSAIRVQNPSPYSSYYYTPEFTVISNSPELLYSVRGREVKTKPIAGTRPRGDTVSDEADYKAELFISEKECAEHLMLVDLERNDLGRFCEIGSVVVEKFMECELYADVMHIVSTVTGRAKEGVSAPEMLQHLFPGGTITGAPKIRSIEIIDELENADRKFYTGSLGFFDHNGNCDTNILIRTLLIQEEEGRFKGEMHFGAGIVADSIPEKEYEETRHKAASWMKMLTKKRKL